MVSQSRPDVLNLRPQPQATRFHAVLRARYGQDLRIYDSPLLAPRFLMPTLPEGRFGAVIFTSETGVAASKGLGQDVPRLAFCVGGRTAQVAQAAGFETITAEGDAVSLLAILQQHTDKAPFLHLHGREVTGDISGDLRRLGLPATGVVVYAQEAQPLTPEVCQRLAQGGPLLVPLFSPRSARLFRAALEGIALAENLQVLALSPAVATAFGLYHGPKIAVAKSPEQAELLLQMDRFLEDT